jgi:hypothetical protein
VNIDIIPLPLGCRTRLWTCYHAHGTALGTVTMLVRRIAMYGPDYFTIAAYFPLKNN